MIDEFGEPTICLRYSSNNVSGIFNLDKFKTSTHVPRKFTDVCIA